jgi:hypothetical protein
MASRPNLQALAKAIEKIGGDDVIFDQIAEGLPMREIAAPFGFSRQMIYAWIHSPTVGGGPDRERRWEEAKAIAAHSLIERAGEILDEADPANSAEASIIQARSNHRKWLASVYNRKAYGEDTPGKIDLNLNIGSLHLDALRVSGSMAGRPIMAPAVLALPSGDDDEEAAD